MITADPRRIGATSVSARSPAPDLARGAMLLLIALANVHIYLYAHPIGVRGYPIPQTALDRTVALVQMTVVDGRAYPMFALLFGYGIVQLQRRQTGGGLAEQAVHALVRRRGRWLIGFGFGHALLLFSGDILGAYGLLAAGTGGLLLRAGDRKLLTVAAFWTVPAAVLGALQGLPVPDTTTSALPSTSLTAPLVAAWSRVLEWVGLTVVVAVFSLVPALLLGVWAARRRVLDEPERYRPLLTRVAVFGIGTAVLGGLPMALMVAWWPQSPVPAVAAAGAVHALSGYAGGLGYAAIAGLMAIRVHRRGGPGPVVTALGACGQRSLTCYLLQSVVFVAVLASYGGGLGDRVGLAGAAALAAATWALSVLLADGMRRRGHRGPAEILLRRLTYRTR